MENKGLCVSCVSDKDCVFYREFPLLYCEEFSCEKPKSATSESKKIKRTKRSHA